MFSKILWPRLREVTGFFPQAALIGLSPPHSFFSRFPKAASNDSCYLWSDSACLRSFLTPLQAHFGTSEPFGNTAEQKGASPKVAAAVNCHRSCSSVPIRSCIRSIHGTACMLPSPRGMYAHWPTFPKRLWPLPAFQGVLTTPTLASKALRELSPACSSELLASGSSLLPSHFPVPWLGPLSIS